MRTRRRHLVVATSALVVTAGCQWILGIGTSAVDDAADAATTITDATATDAFDALDANDAGDPVVALAAGHSHACALRSSGTVWCWGAGAEGQLGADAGTIECARPCRAFASRVEGVSDAVEIAAGATSTCARIRDSRVMCWGSNAFGQLGHVGGDVACGQLPCNPRPTFVASLSGATRVAVGRATACAIVAGGVRCWGNHQGGLLGPGVTAPSATPVAIAGLTGVVDVQVDVDDEANRACARTQDGRIWCWGSDLGDRGSLGHAPVDGGATATPVVVGAVDGSAPRTDFVSLNVARRAGCGRLADGGFACWGDHGWGLLGPGAGIPNTSPHPLPIVSARNGDGPFGRHEVQCLIASRRLSCWGNEGTGVLATWDGAADPSCDPAWPCTYVPMDLALDGVVEVALGVAFAVARDESGALYAWGRNDVGQLGHANVVDTRCGSGGPTMFACDPVPRRVVFAE